MNRPIMIKPGDRIKVWGKDSKPVEGTVIRATHQNYLNGQFLLKTDDGKFLKPYYREIIPT